MKDEFKKNTLHKFGWSMSEISKTPMRNKWKKYYKKPARRKLREQLNEEINKNTIDEFKEFIEENREKINAITPRWADMTDEERKEWLGDD